MTLQGLEQRRMLATVDVVSTTFLYDANVGDASPHKLEFKFDQDVTGIFPGPMPIVDNVTFDESYSIGWVLDSYNFSAGVTTVVYEYDPDSSGSTVNVLPDGNYRAVLAQDEVLNGSMEGLTDDAILDFFVLSSDFSGWTNGGTDDPQESTSNSANPRDGEVSTSEVNAVSAAYGTSNKKYSQGNVNYSLSGDVTFADLLLSAQQAGKKIYPAATGPDDISLATLYPGEVTVSWTDVSDGEDGYRIQISDDGTDFTSIPHRNVHGSKQSYTFRGLDQGVRYWFRVRAYSNADSNPNGPDTAYTPKENIDVMMEAPSIKSWYETGATEAMLGLRRIEGATEYRVYSQSTISGSWTLVNTIGQETSGDPIEEAITISASAAAAQYRVQAYNTDFDEESSYTYLTLPAAASNLRYEVVSGDFMLYWDDNSERESDYLIERSSNFGSSWTTVDTIDQDLTSFHDTAFTPSANTWYWYRVTPVLSGTTFDPLPSATIQVIQSALPSDTPISKNTILGTAQGADGGDPASLTFSQTGVRYSDGALRLSTVDVESPGFGSPVGIERSYANLDGYRTDDAFGNGWVMKYQPLLKKIGGNDDILAVVFSGTDAMYFDKLTENYIDYWQARDFRTDRIYYDSGADEYRLISSTGGVIRFHDFVDDSINARQHGHLKSIDGSMNAVYYNSGDGPDLDGRLKELVSVGDNKSEKYIFTWGEVEVDSDVWRISNVELYRDSATQRLIDYDYYGINEVHGNHGDLKHVTIKEADNTTVIDEKYYRYYTPYAYAAASFNTGLKFSFDTRAYARLTANVIDDLDTISDGIVDGYADYGLVYDTIHRVSSIAVKGLGSSEDSGIGIFDYTYSNNTNGGYADGDNVWKTETIESLPIVEGDLYQTVYSTYRGEVVLSTRSQYDEGEELLLELHDFYEYDTDGRLTMHATPTAITDVYTSSVNSILDESDADSTEGNLAGLADSAGLIYRFNYSTIEDPYTERDGEGPDVEEPNGHLLDLGEDGELPGYLISYSVARGETDGSPDTQMAFTYFGQELEKVDGEMTGIWVAFMASSTRYTAENGGGAETTDYEYEYQGFNNGITIEVFGEYDPDHQAPQQWILQTTVKLPVVTDGQNGDDNVRFETVTILDENGRVGSYENERGDVTTYAYDTTTETGALTKVIVDVGGLELTTEYLEFDELGRPTLIIDPNGNETYVVYNDADKEKRIYRGWYVEADVGYVTGPIEVIRDDQANGYLEVLTANVTLTTADYEDLEDAAFTKVQSITRHYFNTADQLTGTRKYYNLSGLAYSTSPNLGTSANYHISLTGYDERGNVNREQDFGGTITRYIRNGADWITSMYVGTNDRPETGSWSPSNNSNGGELAVLTNMTNVAEFEYNKNGASYGPAMYPGGNESDRYVSNYLDWRDRPVAVKYGSESEESSSLNRPIEYYTYDNLNRVTSVERYDGDDVNITTTNGVPVAPSSTLLRAKSSTFFDSLGRVYQQATYDVDQGDGSVGDALVTNYWYDESGNLIKSRSSGGMVTKYTYDDAHRNVATYITDGRDDDNTLDGPWAEAKEIDDDLVMEQYEYTYDANGNVIYTVKLQRPHTQQAGADEELGSINPSGLLVMLGERPDSIIGGQSTTSGAAALPRVYRSINAYDRVNRTTESVQLGFNDGYELIWDDDPTEMMPERSVTAEVESSGAVSDYHYIHVADWTTETYPAEYFAGWDIIIDGERYTVTSYDNDSLGDQRLHVQGLADPVSAETEFTLVNPDFLHTSYGYIDEDSKDSGRLQEVTDPRGIKEVYRYDNLSRITSTIEAYDNGYVDSFSSDYDSDRITAYTYDGMNRVVTMTAYGADWGDPENQTTQYVWGVSKYGAGASGISSNNLLKQINYPNTSTGLPSTSASQQESFTYNQLGDKLTSTDRNGTVHTFTYDVMGRVVRDAATTIGSGVYGSSAESDAIRLVEYSYNGLGLVELATNWSVTDYDPQEEGFEDDILNQIKRTYNSFGQVLIEQQEHEGEIDGSTPDVNYNYSATASTGVLTHGSRLEEIVYPNGRSIFYDYATGLDSDISRLTSIIDDDESTHLEDYTYLGASTVVQRLRPENSTGLSYTDIEVMAFVIEFSTLEDPDGPYANATDIYGGLDNHGRIASQRWVEYDGQAWVEDGELDYFRYGYDENSNRTYRTNQLHRDYDELYVNTTTKQYDTLDRLTNFGRGEVDTNALDFDDEFSRSQAWTLDFLGNWIEFNTDSDGDEDWDVEEDRTHDRQNRMTSLDDGSPHSLTFSNNGEMKTDHGGQTYVYDAWGHLIKVDIDGAGGTPAAVYQYDALHRRITEDPDGASGTDPTHLYYSTQWQVLEERLGSSSDPKTQNVWSPIYVDAMILRDRDADNDTGTGAFGMEERLYVQQDANFNVTSLVDDSTVVVERYYYDPYGLPEVLDDDFDVDGTTDVAWKYLHQGGRYDSALKLSHFRYRDLHVELGRWTRQDPAGYKNGVSLLEYLGSNSIVRLDPLGLDWLDDSANFFGGWADGLTFGLTSYARTGINGLISGDYSDNVDTSSGTYTGGLVVGHVHGAILFKKTAKIRGPEYGAWGIGKTGHKVMTAKRVHFHLDWGSGLGKHHLPWQFGNFYRNLKAVIIRAAHEFLNRNR